MLFLDDQTTETYKWLPKPHLHRWWPPSCVWNMSGQVHAGRLRLPKVWHAVSFVPLQKVTLFTLESLQSWWAGRNRIENKRKEKKKSKLDLFDTFDALQRFSSHNCTCEKQTIATEVELALAKLKYKAWETCGSNSRAFWYLSTEAQKIIWIKWIKIISAQTWEICCHVS